MCLCEHRNYWKVTMDQASCSCSFQSQGHKNAPSGYHSSVLVAQKLIGLRKEENQLPFRAFAANDEG